MLMMKKNQVKLKQQLIAEIELSVLKQPMEEKDSNQSMYSFSDWRSVINILLVLFSKGNFMTF